MRNLRTSARGALFAAMALSISVTWSGCSPKPITTEVTGKVVYAGKPVFPGSVIVMDEQDRNYVGNLNDKGEFRVQVESSGTIRLAVKTHKLGNAGRVPASGDPAAEEGSREATVPDKFRNANVNIPNQYSSIATSGLSYNLSVSGGDLGTIQLKAGN